MVVAVVLVLAVLDVDSRPVHFIFCDCVSSTSNKFEAQVWWPSQIGGPMRPLSLHSEKTALVNISERCFLMEFYKIYFYKVFCCEKMVYVVLTVIACLESSAG